MRKRISLFLLTSAFTTSLLFAQGPGNGNGGTFNPANMVQRRVQFLTTLLGLRADQQASATTIFTNAITADGTVRSQMRTARQKLQTDIQATPPGPAGCVAATPPTCLTAAETGALQADALAISNLENQVISGNALAEAEFYAILDSSQQATFSQFKSQGRGPFGGGFGGPGGAGPNGFRGPGGPR